MGQALVQVRQGFGRQGVEAGLHSAYFRRGYRVRIVFRLAFLQRSYVLRACFLHFVAGKAEFEHDKSGIESVALVFDLSGRTDFCERLPDCFAVQHDSFTG